MCAFPYLHVGSIEFVLFSVCCVLRAPPTHSPPLWCGWRLSCIWHALFSMCWMLSFCVCCVLHAVELGVLPCFWLTPSCCVLRGCINNWRNARELTKVNGVVHTRLAKFSLLGRVCSFPAFVLSPTCMWPILRLCSFRCVVYCVLLPLTHHLCGVGDAYRAFGMLSLVCVEYSLFVCVACYLQLN